jgi:DNA-directed RNA polymerase subunit H (RpoH/RPB5)
MTREEKLEWLKSLPGETISPKQLSVIADGDPYAYNIAAKEGKLDLPHLWRGRNLRIWKDPVIKLIGG